MFPVAVGMHIQVCNNNGIITVEEDDGYTRYHWYNGYTKVMDPI